MIDMDGLGTTRPGAGFADLICADDQWLRREFDALIAASYGAPPARPGPPAPPRTPPAGRPSRYLSGTHGLRTAPPSGSGRRRGILRRQRSPPAP
ncbi:hypothetical protein [Actinomadura madurae]|uniref:hypothetical protein n=1 Tax=Actinomadura madurae TaxID=1993 RepID=UPI0020D24ADD|nr:hypothetical protein [Actinomadura madurae]MCP9949996.1 hypothetical protein [Actinomadura madurae]MCP9966752.1 hypothetical protein [Actinomadura madurae]MCP9979239.1 hypothetical protein [Actinomadura madurae]MCQ0009233.1 hypothetical protein [Actinomadura madurae]MCQ0015435.1 hypothetical protein [Actinomadura madurae]